MSTLATSEVSNAVWDGTDCAPVLTIDAGLAEALNSEQRRSAARASAARILHVTPGAWRPPPATGVGLLMLEGFVLRRTAWDHRATAELLGPGDVLQPRLEEADATVILHTEWTALTAVRTAVLDATWSARLAPWPAVGAALSQRALDRARRTAAIMTLSQVRRLELRVWLVLWTLADRFGRVRRDGVHLGAPLTHQQLSELAGARRPSVSTAVARLVRAGVVRQLPTSWLLCGAPPQSELDAAGDGHARDGAVVPRPRTGPV
jgi:CRP/FNR family transcriptional regulator, cyclic AMP receptor protein